MNRKNFGKVEAAVAQILAGWEKGDITNWIHAGWTADDDRAPDLAAWTAAAEEKRQEMDSETLALIDQLNAR